MATQITNHKCPACTGPLHFDGASGKLKCDYCDSSFTVEEIEALYADEEKKAQEATEQAMEEDPIQEEDADWEMSEDTDWGEDLKAYNCPSCGAELICDETTAATSCPYCGNPTIIPGQFGGTLKPDYVIPFKLGKEDAKKALKQYYKGKKFLPKDFMNENHLDEIKGIYVPFWLFDGEISADIRFHATRVHRRRSGNTEITTTEHYSIRRAGTVPFCKIPVDGSTKMPDEHMDAVEPYDYSELKPFSTAYLPGFLADKYDVPAEQSSVRANERASNTAYDVMRNSVSGYATCTPVNKALSLKKGSVKYALLPVWVLNTKWKDKNFLFTMNGQTGKLIGNLPVDWGKYWIWFACISVPLMVILSLILLF